MQRHQTICFQTKVRKQNENNKLYLDCKCKCQKRVKVVTSNITSYDNCMYSIMYASWLLARQRTFVIFAYCRIQTSFVPQSTELDASNFSESCIICCIRCLMRRKIVLKAMYIHIKRVIFNVYLNNNKNNNVKLVYNAKKSCIKHKAHTSHMH